MEVIIYIIGALVILAGISIVDTDYSSDDEAKGAVLIVVGVAIIFTNYNFPVALFLN